MVAVLRLADAGDVGDVHRLLRDNADNLVGMSSLPVSADGVERLIDESVSTIGATHRTGDGPLRSQVFFLLEDATHARRTILGVTGLAIDRGSTLTTWRVTSSGTGTELVARLSTDEPRRLELGSTFLAPIARGRGLGRLLSHGRLLWAATLAATLPTIVMAHIRGRIDATGCRFWDEMGGAELGLDVHAALDRCRDLGTFKTLDALPHHTIDLAAAVQAGMGELHPASVPAWRLLTEQGLEPNGMIDPIDGGQTIAAPLNKTDAIRSAELRTLVAQTSIASALPTVSLVTSTAGPFRAISCATDPSPCCVAAITPDEFDALQVSHGDEALVAAGSRPTSPHRLPPTSPRRLPPTSPQG